MAADVQALAKMWRVNAEICSATGAVERAVELTRCAAQLEEAALRAEAGAVGWMPIETAPKDGTRLLLCCAGYNPIVGWWDAGFSKWMTIGQDSLPTDEAWDDYVASNPTLPATHWQPLPPRPSQKE